MVTTTRWQDRVTLGLGAFLFLSPILFGFFVPGGGVEIWHSLVMGGAVIVFSTIALYSVQKWEEGINLAIGIWLVMAPFVLGFTDASAATLIHMLVGVVVGIDAVWVMMLKPPVRKEGIV